MEALVRDKEAVQAYPVQMQPVGHSFVVTSPSSVEVQRLRDVKQSLMGTVDGLQGDLDDLQAAHQRLQDEHTALQKVVSRAAATNHSLRAARRSLQGQVHIYRHKRRPHHSPLTFKQRQQLLVLEQHPVSVEVSRRCAEAGRPMGSMAEQLSPADLAPSPTDIFIPTEEAPVGRPAARKSHVQVIMEELLLHGLDSACIASITTDSAAVNIIGLNYLPGQPPESFRWLRPVYSKAKRSQVRGLMSSTSHNIRFYDRDVSAALNIRRCAVGPGPRPTELCYWEGRPAMPKRGRPGQEWVYLPDKALLRKWRRKWRQ
ncbi:hypothetical protein QJQ45_026380 [Haematococcus lacustris]|nr:hypothetical protein QJQ45_026380 [Haematococcus lacustris]